MDPQVPLAGLIGAIAGSFLATWAVRLEEQMTIVRGRSRCDRCGAAVRAKHNIPILSYLLLRGRCARCATLIDRRHPLLEISCLLLGATSVAVRPGADGWTGAAFGWALATLAVIDARRFRLPDILVLPLLGAGLLTGGIGPPPPLADRLWGAAGGFAALTLLAAGYRAVRGRDGLGRGDAKLLAAIGAWIGWRPLPWTVLIAASLGLAWTGLATLRGKRVSATDRLPLGTLLAIAAWPVWISGPW